MGLEFGVDELCDKGYIDTFCGRRVLKYAKPYSFLHRVVFSDIQGWANQELGVIKTSS